MALLTVDEIKSYLEITGTASDGVLATYSAQVQAEVDNYLDRTIEQTTYTGEVLKYKNSVNFAPNFSNLGEYGEYYRVFLDEFPVEGLVIKYKDNTVTASDYRLESELGMVIMYNYYDDFESNLTADYTAGYLTSTLPKDLKGVLLEGVKMYYESSGETKRIGSNVKSKSIKDFSVTYGLNEVKSVMVNGRMMKRYIAESQFILDKYSKTDIW